MPLAEADVYEMHAVHDAFRRDLDRLARAVAAGRAGAPTVRAGWANFTWQLLVHHSVEDADLWPRLRRAVADRPGDLALLADMEAEHARIGPLIAAVDAALAGHQLCLAERAGELASALRHHFHHEEDRAIPLMRAVLTAADLRGFKSAMARRQGLAGAATFIPWVTDEMPAAGRRRLLALMPAPARLANWLLWDRRYRKRKLWAC